METANFDYEKSVWGHGMATLKWSDPTRFRLYQALRLASCLPAEPHILEIGCGAGQFIRALKSALTSSVCYGCDVSDEALKQAESYSSNILYQKNNDQSLPYGDSSMDAVFIFDVLEHVTNPAQLLQEVGRVLKPGGLFYCFVPCEGDWLSLWHALDILHLKHDVTKKYAGHINYFSRRSLKKMIKKEGFGRMSIRYSEHILGQFIGVVSFFLMDRFQKKSKSDQVNNEFYFSNLKEKNQANSLFKLCRSVINILINVESHLFSHIPSPNVHIIAQKQ